VILSWKASAPVDAKHAAAVGYCIYRSTPRKDSPRVLLNSVPFRGTSCMDDQVENGKLYYYRVRAINANSRDSKDSNLAPAPIPTLPRTNPDSRPSVPACREAKEK
jgi:hypothetical protein